MENIEEIQEKEVIEEKLNAHVFNFVGIGIVIIFLLNIGLMYLFYCLQLEVAQNNEETEKLKREIVVNNRNFSKIYKEVTTINRNFTRATENEIEKDVEIEELYIKLDNEIAKNDNNGVRQRKAVLPEDETRIVEKFKNALFNEYNIKEASLTNVSGTKILLPINQKARNKNSKEYIKNLIGKLKSQYNFDDYKIEITWKDETASSI